MRIGYSCWGFLGPGVLDTPDGSRAYRRPLIDGLIGAGHHLVLLQTNRDLAEAGLDLRDQYRFDAGLPELDALMVEWRWPLPGRNTTACGSTGHTCDLHRQAELLEEYTHRLGRPTVIWDLDRQLPTRDPLRGLTQVMVCELALYPTPGATTLLCPVPDAALDTADPKVLAALPRPVPLVYVGNQYDRDDAFDRFFAPAAAKVAHRVAGKWPATSRWPHVTFTGRCPYPEVDGIHRQALATVLLAPQRYARVGQVTSRLFEALLAGCLPIVPMDHAAADHIAPWWLHAADGAEVAQKVEHLQCVAGTMRHAQLIASCLRLLDPMRLSRQLAILNGVLATLAEITGTARR